MRVLILTNNPDRASFRLRVKVYIPMLEAAGIACEVAAFPENPLARWRLLSSAGRYDGVLLQKKGLNAIESWLIRKYSACLIYDVDDAIMYKQGSPEQPSSGRLRRFARSVKAADLVIAGNAYLADHAARYGANVVILPTGLDTAAHHVPMARIGDGRLRLGWIGSASTLPYLQSIVPVLDRIAADSAVPLTLRVISDEFPEVATIALERCPWSQASQYIDLAACDIGLAPLDDDAFARGKCGFKVLQYQSAGLPVICSPVGMNADLVRDGQSGFHARTDQQWMEAIGRLASDQTLRVEMGKAGLSAAQSYDRAVIGERFVELISGVLSQHAKAAL